MHDFWRVNYFSSKNICKPLMSQGKTPRSGIFTVSITALQIPKSAGFSGRPGPGEITIFFRSECLDLVKGDFVIRRDHGFFPTYLRNLLKEVKGEGIVVINYEGFQRQFLVTNSSRFHDHILPHFTIAANCGVGDSFSDNNKCTAS